MSVYTWENSRRKPADPQQVGETVERIAKDHPDGASPKTVVAAAANRDSPLHGLFEWDDAIAADKWRCSQASDIIQSLRVVHSETATGERTTPAFYSVKVRNSEGGTSQGYQPIATVAGDAEMRQSAEEILLSQLQGLRRRYEALEMFRPVWEALDKIAPSVG
jgi:hypothetical protein